MHKSHLFLLKLHWSSIQLLFRRIFGFKQSNCIQTWPSRAGTMSTHTIIPKNVDRPIRLLSSNYRIVLDNNNNNSPLVASLNIQIKLHSVHSKKPWASRVNNRRLSTPLLNYSNGSMRWRRKPHAIMSCDCARAQLKQRSSGQPFTANIAPNVQLARCARACTLTGTCCV